MSRYIDADKLSKDVLASWDKDNHVTLEASRVHRQEHHHLMRIIERQPTADVEEIRHGEWIREIYIDKHGNERFTPPRCNLCNNIETFRSKYCPNCGAKMDEERRVENERT